MTMGMKIPREKNGEYDVALELLGARFASGKQNSYFGQYIRRHEVAWTRWQIPYLFQGVKLRKNFRNFPVLNIPVFHCKDEKAIGKVISPLVNRLYIGCSNL